VGHQGGRPVAFFSKPIAPRHAKLVAYERELIELVQAVRHWRPYLWGCHFVVRTNHRSLRFLLDQRLMTIPQHHWASKLLGFDFIVEYKPRTLNVVADARSRRDEHSGKVLAISMPTFALYDEIRQEIVGDTVLSQLQDAVRGGAKPPNGQWRMVWCCSKGGYFSHHHQACCNQFLSLFMALGMRVFTRLYIVYEHIYMSRMIGRWCKTLLALVWCARAIRANMMRSRPDLPRGKGTFDWWRTRR